MHHTVAVPGWPRPKGYSNGVITSGRTLYIAGQIGWQPDGTFVHRDFVGQWGQALDNVLAVVAAAGGRPEDVVKMTIYVTDLDLYRRNLEAVGLAWREKMGKVFPAMALVGVAGLVEREALIEIEAIACLPDLKPALTEGSTSNSTPDLPGEST